MSNQLYPLWKEALLQGLADSDLTGVVKVAIIDTALYTYSGTDQYLDDVNPSAIVGTPQTLASKTFVNGVFDADDPVFPTVSGATIEAIIVYIDTGTPATSRLVAFMDSSIVGLPDTPSGGNYTLIIDSGTYKLFSI